jgi:nucleoside-diphosphate-sugar epimerase
MKILITGGCGYTGTVLVEKLAETGHDIVVVDAEWFGRYSGRKYSNIKFIKRDIRTVSPSICAGIETVIHLANVANDPAVDLNPNLSWEINVLATQKLIINSIKNKAKNFIYASSGSVYGVKKEKKVTELLDRVPISTYNKTKMIAEDVLMSYKDDINIFCIRPATVCGFSSRMRFDLTVNLLTLQAIKKKKITVLGGSQIRPNIHIQDLAAVYSFFVNKNNLKSGFYNAGFDNFSILDIAKKIQKKIDCTIKIIKSNDPRSYRQDSSKLIGCGFKRKFNVDNAIDDIIFNYKKNPGIEKPSCYTVRWMIKNKIS